MELRVPRTLRKLLEGTQYEGALLDFVADSASVLTDNKTPFFPAYSDHGIDHVSHVLDSAVKLIPSEVWESALLQAEDAAALVAAVIVHDFGMHIREAGFEQLVSGSTQHRPVPWFNKQQGNRRPDLRWDQEWESFCVEARQFSRTQLNRILGEGNHGVPEVVHGHTDPASWTEADRLVVGEFIRRHHGRLAHEIALYGFPGIPAAEQVVLGEALPHLSDAIGAIARSHNEHIRVTVSYFEYRNPGNLRPSGTLATYLAALLRISDYLQLQADRAPRVLLRLKNPQSPISVDEWKKHGSIASISWDHKDPSAIFIEVADRHSLSTHLQLRELFADLQREMDASAAVLSEQYSGGAIARLRLSRTRIYTNIEERSLHARLPYLPTRATLRSGDDLFRLVIRDLYGNRPSVAGRELVQNAVDAVRERRRWEISSQQPLKNEAFWPQKQDVLVEVREHSNGSLDLRVVDKGIGMRPETVVDYFLQAGVSPRAPSGEPEGVAEVVDLMKTGRFGIGAFSAFLLGTTMWVRTRHVESARGVEFRVNVNSTLAEIRWADCPVGTEVVVPFSPDVLPESRYHKEESIQERKMHFLKNIAAFYRMRQPTVDYVALEQDGTKTTLEMNGEIPEPGRRLPDHWRPLHVDALEAVLWALPHPGFSPFDDGHSFAMSSARSWRGGHVAHNGMVVRDPAAERMLQHERSYTYGDGDIDSLLNTPAIAIFDLQHRLGISLTRYSLTDSTLFFEEVLLRDIGLDVVAHSLVQGPSQHPLGKGWGLSPVFGRQGWLPLLPEHIQRFPRKLLVLWDAGQDASVTATSIIGNALPSISWSELPLRVSLGLGTRGPIASEDPEVRQWGFRPSHILEASGKLADLCGLRLESAAVWRADPGLAGEVAWDHRDTNSLRPHRSYRGEWTPAGGQWVRWEYSDVEGPPNILRNTAEDLRTILSARTVGLSLFAPDPKSSGPAETALGEPWRETIGSLLPRSDRRRREHAARLVETHSRLRIPVNKWRRLSQVARGV